MKYDIRIIIFTILLVLSSISFSQENKIQDSLKIKLEKAVNYKDSVDVYNNIAKEYYYVNPDKTIEFADKSLKIALKNNYRKGIGVAYNKKGVGYLYKNKTDLAIFYLKVAILYLKNNIDYDLASVYNNLGNCYKQKDDYISFLEYNLKATEIAEKNNFKDLLAITYSNIANVYQECGKFEESANFFNKALKISLEDRNKNKRIIIKSYIGLCYYSYYYKNNSNKALEYLSKVKDIIDKNNTVYNSYLTHIGSVYLKLKKYDIAVNYLEQCVENSIRLNDNLNLMNSSSDLSEYYYSIGNYDKSLQYALIFCENAIRYKRIEILGMAASMVANSYDKKGNKTEAIKYYKISVDNLSKIESIIENFKYVVYDKDLKRIKEQLKAEKIKSDFEIMEMKETKKRWILFSIIAFLILISAISIFTFNQRLKYNKSISTLEKLDMELEFKDKELIAKRKEMEQFAIYMKEKNSFLDELSEIVNELRDNKNIKDKNSLINKLYDVVSQKYSLKEEKKEYDIYIGGLYKDFITNLTLKHPNLTETEKRLAALIKLDYRSKDIAAILNLSLRGVETQRYRLRKKLNFTDYADISEYFASF